MKISIFKFLLISSVLAFTCGFKVEKDPKVYSLNYAAQNWQEFNSFADNLQAGYLTNSFPEKEWWLQFCDPPLNSYINQALTSNKDVKTAIARIEEMEGYTQSALSKELPKLDFNLIYFRFLNTSENFLFANTPATIKNVFLMPLVAQYEVDIFRKNHLGTLSAKKQAEASIMNYKTAQIMVSAGVASDYFNLILTDKLINIQCEKLKLQEALLKHYIHLFNEGIISYDDVLTTKQNISATKSSIEELTKIQGIYVHRLCMLIGVPPVEQSGFMRSDIDRIQLSNNIFAGNPSQLIARRPDILASENLLQQAGIDISVARRQFLPTFNANALFSYSTFQPGNIFNWDSNSSLVGVRASQPVYQGGKLMANLKIKKAVYKQAIETYQKTVLTAFQEVEDSLVSLSSDIKQYNRAQEDVFNAVEKQKLTENRFNEGIASCVEVLVSQQEYLNYKQAEINKKALVMIDNISLYKAIGGGF